MNDNLGQLSLAVIEYLKSKGFTEADIAREFGVSRQAVNYHVRTYNGKRTPRQRAIDEFPFKVPSDQGQTSPFKRLRDHGEYMLTHGKGMSEGKLERLRSFYRKLRDENLVLEFDPTIPPEPGVSKYGGWAYRSRTKRDKDLLIRVNEYTRLTEAGKEIWKFPLTDP